MKSRRPKRDLSKCQKALILRDAVIFIASIAVAVALYILGVVAYVNASDALLSIAPIVFFTTFVLLIVAYLVNFIATKIYIKKVNSKNKEELLSYVYSHREHAETEAKRLEKKLRRLITVTRIYTVAVALAALTLAFFAGFANIGVFYMTVSGVILYGAISRIPLKAPDSFFTEDNGYVRRDKYPEIYAVAEEAAKALGVTGEIKIALTIDFTAGIRRFGDVISVQIGILLHCAVSREELRSILLHEFAHIANEGDASYKLHEHHCHVDENTAGQCTGVIATSAYTIFTLFDTLFEIKYMLYLYTSTIGIEEKADRAMLEHGDAHYAGSAFLKLKYYELYNWERGSYDDPSFFAPEEFTPRSLERELVSYREHTALRRDFWNKLIDVEIISRVATHPTVKMRLDALGHTDYSIKESEDSEAYNKEKQAIVDYIEERTLDARKSGYEKEREESYLAPLKIVTEWEEGGCVITPESYRDVILAYRQIGRISDADALCDRVIETLPDAASHFAYFIKGCTLLHAFDEDGIEYLYHAIEANHNYIEEGMSTIGEFCCISGRRDDLDTYRERVMKLVNEQDEKFSKLNSITPKDVLTKESLPSPIMDELMATVGASRDVISAVYLVRKVITEDYFASAVIIEFPKNVDPDVKYETLDKFFYFLDTQDWEFTLFDANDVPMNAIKKIPSSKIYSKDTVLKF